MGGVAYRRPPEAHVYGDEALLDELRARTAGGKGKIVAIDSGVGNSHLSKILHGKKPVTVSVAEYLGFQLAWIPKEGE